MHSYAPPQRPYIDCHCHIGRTLDRTPKVGQSTTMCLARYAQTGVYAAIAAPPAVGTCIARGTLDVREQNAVIARARRDFPDRFPVTLALIEPRFGDIAVEELEWALSELQMNGMVGHPPYFTEWYNPFLEAVAARGGLVNLHLGDEMMLKAARLFPRAQFIVHSSRWAVENMARLDNCWFEVVQHPEFGGSAPWDFEWMASRLGRERIIFGADLPYYDFRHLQSKIEAAPIDDDLKDRIAFRNIQSLIRHYNPDWTMPDSPPESPRQFCTEELWAHNSDNPERLAVFA